MRISCESDIDSGVGREVTDNSGLLYYKIDAICHNVTRTVELLEVERFTWRI